MVPIIANQVVILGPLFNVLSDDWLWIFILTQKKKKDYEFLLGGESRGNKFVEDLLGIFEFWPLLISVVSLDSWASFSSAHCFIDTWGLLRSLASLKLANGQRIHILFWFHMRMGSHKFKNVYFIITLIIFNFLIAYFILEREQVM